MVVKILSQMCVYLLYKHICVATKPNMQTSSIMSW